MNVALVVKNSDENWEVAVKRTLPDDRLAAFKAAFDGGSTINGMKTTAYKETVLRGATWDGSSFSGGENYGFPEEDTDWDVYGTFSILIDNVVFVTFIQTKNDAFYDMLDAAFSSEVTLVPIELEQRESCNVGSIWNGQEFTPGT